MINKYTNIKQTNTIWGGEVFAKPNVSAAHTWIISKHKCAPVRDMIWVQSMKTHSIVKEIVHKITSIQSRKYSNKKIIEKYYHANFISWVQSKKTPKIVHNAQNSKFLDLISPTKTVIPHLIISKIWYLKDRNIL